MLSTSIQFQVCSQLKFFLGMSFTKLACPHIHTGHCLALLYNNNNTNTPCHNSQTNILHNGSRSFYSRPSPPSLSPHILLTLTPLHSKHANVFLIQFYVRINKTFVTRFVGGETLSLIIGNAVPCDDGSSARQDTRSLQRGRREQQRTSLNLVATRCQSTCRLDVL